MFSSSSCLLKILLLSAGTSSSAITFSSSSSVSRSLSNNESETFMTGPAAKRTSVGFAAWNSSDEDSPSSLFYSTIFAERKKNAKLKLQDTLREYKKSILSSSSTFDYQLNIWATSSLASIHPYNILFLQFSLFYLLSFLFEAARIFERTTKLLLEGR